MSDAGVIAGGAEVRAARAVMASRAEPLDSADFFPTPPWATRALCEAVLGIAPRGANDLSVWEPACGEGHMALPLAEYFGSVFASDLVDRGFGEPFDFLSGAHGVFERADWVITNPPFGALALEFILRALALRPAGGVAMFLPLRYLEGIGRCLRLYAPYPPTQLVFFAERVPLYRGAYVPNGTTATAYMWVVWRTGWAPQPPMWLGPGQADRFFRQSDLLLASLPGAVPEQPLDDGALPLFASLPEGA